MAINLRGRNFLKIADFTPRELRYLLDLAHDFKSAKYIGNEVKQLTNKNIVLLFQKDSTRTRCAFEVAAKDQGMGTVYIGSTGSHTGTKESIADTATVLGRFFDGIQFRGFGHEMVEELAKHAGVPVWNGLTNEWHPTQMLADLMTMEEEFGVGLKGIKFAYFGDAHSNMGNSYVIMCAKMGLECHIASPKSLWPNLLVQKEGQKISQETGAKIIYTEDVITAAKDAHVIATDVWVSMGEPKSVWKERMAQLKAYQVNHKIMSYAATDAIFLHCLPAFHDTNTKVAKAMEKDFPFIKKGIEVTDEVFKSSASRAFDGAENRLHTIKAIMVATIGN